MSKTKNLKTLILKNTLLTGWVDIKLCSSLTSLDLSGNRIMDGEAYSLAAAIAPASVNLKRTCQQFQKSVKLHFRLTVHF